MQQLASQRVFMLIMLTAFILLTALPSLANDKSVIAVIVSNDHPTKLLSLSELKMIYWRKKSHWANGQRMHPVNLPSAHPLRLQFSNSVLGSLPNTQNSYWNGLYFHGISPPHVVHSDEAAIRYVQETTGSIAYIDACKVDNRVTAILWIMPNGDTTSDEVHINCN